MTNPLATAEQLYQRQNLSLLPNDLQDVIFYLTQSLTQAAGVLLQLPESITAQANVVLARYWLVESRPLMANEFSVSIILSPMELLQPALTYTHTHTYTPPRTYQPHASSSLQSSVRGHARQEISPMSTPTYSPAHLPLCAKRAQRLPQMIQHLTT